MENGQKTKSDTARISDVAGEQLAKCGAVKLNSGRRVVAIPGPSMIPERVLAAFSEPMPDIYAGEIVETSESVRNRMGSLAQTEAQGFIVTGNGHAAWQVATSNTLAAGDRVLVLESGLFPRVWGQYTGVSQDLNIEYFPGSYHSAVDLEALERRLTSDSAGEIRAVLMAQVDTASSVRNDVAGVREVLDRVGHDALLMVDCVASLATERFLMDQWRVDIALASCQKGLMVPPGIAFVWASDKALKAYERADRRVGYFDWDKRLDTSSMYNYYAGTPPIAHLRAMSVALDLIEEEGGIENVWARHEVLANAVRDCVSTWAGEDNTAPGSGGASGAGGAAAPGSRGPVGFNIGEVSQRSNCVTTVLAHSFDAAELRRRCDEGAGLVLGMGLEGIQGFRIAHMGYLNPPTLLGVLATTEAAMLSMGVDIAGSGVAAAAKSLSTYLG